MCTEKNDTAEGILIQVWENGPYTIEGPFTLNGEQPGIQNALCRCGNSKTKPFCDGSHLLSDFKADGKSAETPSPPRRESGKTLSIASFPQGPFQIDGNSLLHGKEEIASDKSKPVFLCRCGQSSNKPFCDGSHKAIEFDG